MIIIKRNFFFLKKCLFRLVKSFLVELSFYFFFRVDICFKGVGEVYRFGDGGFVYV